jgi:hypothetical protein
LETPYKAVTFAKHDIVTREVMDQLETNARWIVENTPRGRFYRGSGEPRPENLVLVAGKVIIPANKNSDSATVKVSFPRAFANNCHPAVTTAVNADFQRRIHCVVTGPNNSSYPNSHGFDVKVNVAAEDEDNDYIKAHFWVNWIAVGFREATVNDL